jgi:5-(carboxyamino)imidazole ribonucleotide synthase
MSTTGAASASTFTAPTSPAVSGAAAPGVRELSHPRPTAVVAMVGAGQLARMTQGAAIPLGVELRVLAGGEDEPAALAGATVRLGQPASLGDLRALADGADVLTFDHEQIPTEHLWALEAEGVALAPRPAAKLMAQDKLHARRELARLGYPVPPFRHAQTGEDVVGFGDEHGWPLIGKTPRDGYDGRGVFPLADLDAALRALETMPNGLLLEPMLELTRELAILVARSTTGETAAYPVVETVQQDGMCREIIAPAQIDPELADRAREIALSLARDIDATGIMAVELFDTTAGLLINELALRPHNSGHYTIEGCETSQFEQHLRAVLGWPLGDPALRAPAVVTVNVVGPRDGSDPASRLPAALAVSGAHVHLYAKTARPGRKLGHVTVCGDELESVREAAGLAVAALDGETL